MAYAQPIASMNLGSDLARHGPAASALTRGLLAQGGRQDKDDVRAAFIQAIGLVISRGVVSMTADCCTHRPVVVWGHSPGAFLRILDELSVTRGLAASRKPIRRIQLCWTM